MDRGGPHYLSEDREFSLPEGVVDLVETRRGPKASSGNGKSSHGPKTNRSTRQAGKGSVWLGAVKLVLVNLFVCGLVLGYALLGSFVFLALETGAKLGGGVHVQASGYPVRPGENNLTQAILNSLQSEQIQNLKTETVRTIWDVTLSMNILYPDNWTRMTEGEVGHFQRALVDRIVAVVENASVLEVHYHWTFPRAFLFALTTLTTIGYGGIGPKSASAKAATMVYALLGIPIMLWYLSNVGSLLARIVRCLCARLCCCSGGCDQDPPPLDQVGSSTNNTTTTNNSSSRGNCDEDQRTDTEADRLRDRRRRHNQAHRHRPALSLVLFLSSAALVGYISAGSYIVARWEGWALLDAFYFCFLTLTTISFGDLRLQKGGGLERLSPRTEWFCSFFILFGMALTSMFFNILHHEISIRLKYWAKPTQNSNNNPQQQLQHKKLQNSQNQANHVLLKHASSDLQIAHQNLADDSNSNAIYPGGPDLNSETLPGKGGKMNTSNSRGNYSVHFSNFSPSGGHHRDYTEETLLSTGDGHHGGTINRGCGSDSYDCGGPCDLQDEDYVISHGPIPPPRDLYGFPR